MTVVGFFYLVAFFFFLRLNLVLTNIKQKKLFPLFSLKLSLTFLQLPLYFQNFNVSLTLLLTMNSYFSDLTFFFKMQTQNHYAVSLY